MRALVFDKELKYRDDLPVPSPGDDEALVKVTCAGICKIGSRCGPFPDAIKAIESGKVKLYPLISAEYSIEEGIKAFEHASQKGTLKVILKLD